MQSLNLPSRIEQRKNILSGLISAIKQEQDIPQRPHYDWIWMTEDFSCLGFALKMKNEGRSVVVVLIEKDDEKKKRALNMVGKNQIDVVPIEEFWPDREQYKDSYWAFDFNFKKGVEYRKILDSEGFKRIIGGSDIAFRMEKDRKFGTDLAAKYGLISPPTFEFSNQKDGISFLEQNSDKAYVYKPDGSEDSKTTMVPDIEDDDMANEELRQYMGTLKDEQYILQERKKGIETNIEVWFHEGDPVFAWAAFEGKRARNKELGALSGSSHEIGMAIPIDCEAVRQTVGKMFPFYQSIKYTGFGDANVIVCDRQVYFLEFCARFGYTAHCDLFYGLAKDGMSQILEDLIDGGTDGFYDHFKYGYCAAVCLYTEIQRTGNPIMFKDDSFEDFYSYDTYSEDGKMFLAGYSDIVGSAMGHDYTPKKAACEALENASHVYFPGRSYRSDLDKEDYPNSPIERIEALNTMDWFEEK